MTEQVIDEAIDQYSNMVYRVAFSCTGKKSDADDLFQEVFLRYIRRKPIFESEEHARAWFIRVTINCGKRFHTSAWRRKTVPLDDEIVFEMRDEMDLYHELIRLPAKYRAVIHLFYYENLKVEQISQVLGRKPSTVRAQLTRARVMLEERLKGEFSC